MAQLEGSDRYDGVVEYLRSSVNKLLSGSPFVAGKKHKIDPSTVSSRLVDVLKSVLSSERERDLDALITKLDGMMAERARLQGERNQIRETTQREADKYLQENSRLQQEHARLEEELRRIEEDHESKRQIYREQLSHKKAELNQFRSIAAVAQTAQRSLADEVEVLRQTALKMHRNQVRYCRKARDLCVDQLNLTIASERKRLKDEQADKLSRLETILQKERVEYEKNQRQCQQLLEAIWSMRKGQPHPNITAADFPERIPELKAFVDSALDWHQKSAVQELKLEITRAIPDLDFGNDSVLIAVQKYIARKVAEKEDEYERELQRESQTETRLRERMKESVVKMERIEKLTVEDDYMADFEQLKSEWDLQKRQLDQKMRDLQRERTMSHVSITDAEFE
jgi:hypothetical protein